MRNGSLVAASRVVGPFMTTHPGADPILTTPNPAHTQQPQGMCLISFFCLSAFWQALFPVLFGK